MRQALKSEIRALSQLRLEALQNEPEAFSRDYQADQNNSLADWERWLQQRNDSSTSVIFVAEVDNQLAGMMGIVRGQSSKTQHNGMIWGVYVRPGYRRQGIGKQLTTACLQWAQASGVEVVKLGVTDTNIGAIQLYIECGFRVYGVAPKALRHNAKDYDEILMVKDVSQE